MIPQITKRQIGQVVIIDIKGALSGPWALRVGVNLKQAVKSLTEGQKVIFNLRQVSGLDTLGTRSMLECTSEPVEAAFLAGSSAVMDLVGRFPESKRFRVFRDEQELIQAFGEDFVKAPEGVEHRSSPRLQTALPLEFDYEEDGEEIKFQAIVTNLSETGLLAEYIDLKTAEESLERLNPYDLKTLHLRLFLPRRKVIHTEGKVVHRNLNGEQMAIGIKFSNIALSDQEEIRHFLKLSGVQSQ